MLKKVDFKRLLIAVLSVAALVLIQLIVTKGTYVRYEELIKPELAPPAIVFPIVWTILYAILVVTIYFTFDNKKILFFIYLNLVINIIWPMLFFKLGWLLVAVYWLILLIISLIHLLKLLFNERKWLAYINIPYLLWCFFALYLNIMIYLINK